MSIFETIEENFFAKWASIQVISRGFSEFVPSLKGIHSFRRSALTSSQPPSWIPTKIASQRPAGRQAMFFAGQSSKSQDVTVATGVPSLQAREAPALAAGCIGNPLSKLD